MKMCSEIAERYDTVVIGGGLSGLAAARDLSHSGLSVLVVEGRNRLGGRVTSRKFGDTDFVIELGGMYVETDREPHVLAEIERYNIALAEPHIPEEFRWHVGGKLQSTTEMFLTWSQDFERALHRILTDVDRIDPEVPLEDQHLDDLNIPFGDYVRSLDVGQVCQDFLAGWSASYIGAALEDVSALSMLEIFASKGHSLFGAFIGEFRQFAGGTSSLVDAIAGDTNGDLLLSTTVRRVVQHADQIVATLGDGRTVVADRVVCAVPLNVLKDLEFVPPLPVEKAKVVERGHPNHVTKMYVAVEGLERPIFAIGTGGGLQVLQTDQQQGNTFLLVGFGVYPDQISFNDFDTVQRAVHHFAPEATVVAIDGHDWNADQFSRGAWVTLRPGEISAAAALSAPHGRVIFAGADTSNERGMEGALRTGARAGREVLKAFAASRSSHSEYA